jgi:hypothetical protein
VVLLGNASKRARLDTSVPRVDSIFSHSPRRTEDAGSRCGPSVDDLISRAAYG